MPQPYDAPFPPPAEPEAAPADRTWSVLAHLSGLLVYTFPLTGGLPVLGVLGPLAIWLAHGRGDAATERHARLALDFQITAALALLACGVLTLVLIGWLLLPLVVVAHGYATIAAARRASDGREPDYPVSLRIVGPLVGDAAPR